MTAPAFICRCIEQAEAEEGAGGEVASWCFVNGNHFDTFWRSIARDGTWLPSELIPMLEAHYEAHTLGSPHSHTRIVLQLNCSCHHVEQNYAVDPGDDVRGRGLVKGSKLAP